MKDAGGITQITEAGAGLHTRGQAIVNNKLVSGADYRKVACNPNSDVMIMIAILILFFLQKPLEDEAAPYNMASAPAQAW